MKVTCKGVSLDDERRFVKMVCMVGESLFSRYSQSGVPEIKVFEVRLYWGWLYVNVTTTQVMFYM